MNRRRLAGLVLPALALAAVTAAGPGDRVHVSPDSDPRAVAVAQAVVERMGGWEAWDGTRYLVWTFFGRRHLWWDRRAGDVRIETDRGVVLLNVDTRAGRVWRDGVEITNPDSLAAALEEGRQIWVNDSYWLIMPFKLLDPGVTLKYGGEASLPDGRAADVLVLTFGEGIGYTPENRYEVFVARDSGLVEQWSFFAAASDAEPKFTLPWAGWTKVGGVMIATDHGRGDPWPVSAPASLPASVFRDPAPVPR
jgi:hypothetical protein